MADVINQLKQQLESGTQNAVFTGGLGLALVAAGAQVLIDSALHLHCPLCCILSLDSSIQWQTYDSNVAETILGHFGSY